MTHTRQHQNQETLKNAEDLNSHLSKGHSYGQQVLRKECAVSLMIDGNEKCKLKTVMKYQVTPSKDYHQKRPQITNVGAIWRKGGP